MNGPGIRASQADRERTVGALQREVGTGRLTLDEFAERSTEAYEARTLGELSALTRDLPPHGRDEPVRAGVPAPLALAVLLAVALLAFAALGAVAFPCH